MSNAIDRDDMDDPCEMMVDLDCYCDQPAAQSVHEPYTPGRFAMRLCAEHAKSRIVFGYFPGATIETEEVK